MKFGICFANIVGRGDPSVATELAQTAERSGFESVWTIDHVVVPANYESRYPFSESGKMPRASDRAFPEPLLWLAHIAAATTTLRLGTGILVLPQRDPVLLAKQVSTLDVLSGGRVELGVGVGWLAEETEAMGVDFRTRGRRMDEGLDVLRSLWTSSPASYQGEMFSFDDIHCSPMPAKGDIPVHVGGDSPVSMRRAARIGNGYFPGTSNPQELRDRLARLDAELVAVGREAGSLEITVADTRREGAPSVAEVQELQDAGVDRLLIAPFQDGVPFQEHFGQFSATVISSFAKAERSPDGQSGHVRMGRHG